MASGSGPPSFTPPWPFLVLCSWPIASILVVNSPKKLRLARHSLALSESVKFYRVRPRLESSLRWIGEKDGITRLSAANRANCWSNVFKRSDDTGHARPHTFLYFHGFSFVFVFLSDPMQCIHIIRRYNSQIISSDPSNLSHYCCCF